MSNQAKKASNEAGKGCIWILIAVVLAVTYLISTGKFQNEGSPEVYILHMEERYGD